MPAAPAADAAGGLSFADDDVSVSAAPAPSSSPRPTFSNADLFSAVESSIVSCKPLVDLFFSRSSNTAGGGDGTADTNLTLKQRREAICALVRTKFNKVHSRRLFAGLLPLLQTIVEEERYVPDEDDEGNLVEDAGAESSRAILYLRCCAFLVEAHLDGLLQRQGNKSRRGTPKKIEVIDEAFEVAEILHEMLFPLHACGAKEARHTQSAIFGLCEKYWHGNFEDREQVVTQLVPLLLVKSLDDTAQKNDVKRLYSIREAIDLLDFQDESIASLKTHLLRTVGNPLFLQSVEGRKFITHLFQVDANLVGDLHRAVRAQIVGAKKSILNAYADIYFSAWKGSAERGVEEEGDDEEDGTNVIRTSIEENALQDLVYQVIHAAVPSTARSVRLVLDKFYVNKKSPDVEGMLHRTHGPLLWRGLAATDSRIRKQAAGVLTITFPLRDPEAGTEQTEACVQRSVEALVALMKDDSPNVRVEGSKATARILCEFWSAVPSKDIRRLLNLIIAKHASDVSSPAVRAAAVNAVAVLLEEDRTHAVLRPLLPSLGNLIHDKIERVRLSVVKMLLLVKRIKGMKYYHVVSAQNLLARLADEGRGRNNPCGPVAKGLSDLLSNSFFPTGSKRTAADVVNRTLRLLSDNPQAAVTFYRNASSQLSVGSISRLIAALMRCLCFFVVEEKRYGGEDVSDLSLILPEDGAIEGRGGKPNPELMATIAESVSILWESIEDDLNDGQNEDAVEIIMEVFLGSTLTEVYCHFEAKCDSDGELKDPKVEACFRACAAILHCAGKVGEPKIDGLRSHIIEQLSKSSDLPVEKRMEANFGPSVALLCSWEMTDDVAQCLASSISQYFAAGSDDMDTSVTRKSKRKQGGKKKKAADDELPRLDIDVSLNTLSHIIKGANPAATSARKSILESESAFKAIESALKTAQSAADGIDLDEGVDMVRRIAMSMECYGRLFVYKATMKGDFPLRLTPELRALIEWAANTILPSATKRPDGQDDTLRDLDLSSIMGSPVSTGPSRNASSPNIEGIGDQSFIAARESNLFEDKAKVPTSQLATTIAAWPALCLLAEWQSLGLVEPSFLSRHVARLCKTLDGMDSALRVVLLPWLFRVAITTLKDQGDSALLKEVLVGMKNASPSPEEEDIVTESAAIAMQIRDESTVKAAISTAIHVTRTIIVDADDDASTADLPFGDRVGRCMRTFLDCIMREKRSSLLLAQYLIGESKASSVRECLLREVKMNAPTSDALNEVLRSWSSENEKEDAGAPADDDKENADVNQIQPEPIAA